MLNVLVPEQQQLRMAQQERRERDCRALRAPHFPLRLPHLQGKGLAYTSRDKACSPHSGPTVRLQV